MVSILLSTLAAMFMPTGCTTPGWSFCVRMPVDATMELTQDVEDFIVYHYEMPDGSDAFIYVGWAPQIHQGGQWSERRQGLETVRWQANGEGRIDYYTERVWAESVGIPRFLHAWIEASETGEISDAEALIQTLRSCDPRMCPAPSTSTPEISQRPATPPLPADANEDLTEDSREPPQIEPVSVTEIAAPVMEPLPIEPVTETEFAVPVVEAPAIEPVVQVSDIDIQRSGTETIVEVFRVPMPPDAETLPSEIDVETGAGINVEAEAEIVEIETQPELEPETALEAVLEAESDTQPNESDEQTPPRRRSGPVILTDDN